MWLLLRVQKQNKEENKEYGKFKQEYKRLHTRNRDVMRKTTCEGWGQKMRERDALSFLKYLLIFFQKTVWAIIEIGGYTLH